jgi:tRNA-Thr(GGU) m(6)t(6)A37 methyltransferase TsaA
VSKLTYEPIGIVHSPFKEPKNVPIQATASKGSVGTVEVFSQFVEGLKDLQDFSHIFLLYHFHLTTSCYLMVKPFLEDKLHGVFATRSPARPNKIGLSVVHLLRIENNILHIENVDILEGTPLIDIKPYVPKFDDRKNAKIGWFDGKLDKLNEIKDNGRFCNPAIS